MNKQLSDAESEEAEVQKVPETLVKASKRQSSISTATTSSDRPTPTSAKKRKKAADAAAAIDLTRIYTSTPGGSKNRGAMKELILERKMVQKAHAQATKKIRAEAQRQKRLLEWANKLSNEDLLEVFRQRHENQEAANVKATVKAKATAAASTAH